MEAKRIEDREWTLGFERTVILRYSLAESQLEHVSSFMKIKNIKKNEARVLYRITSPTTFKTLSLSPLFESDDHTNNVVESHLIKSKKRRGREKSSVLKIPKYRRGHTNKTKFEVRVYLTLLFLFCCVLYYCCHLHSLTLS